MIILDTNILVRYVTQDDPGQAQQVNQLIEAYDSIPNSMLIPDEVVIEATWVLSSCYERPREEIYAFLSQMAQVESFSFEDDDLMREAIRIFGETHLDIADILLVILARRHKSKLVTFDNELRKAFPRYTNLPSEVGHQT
ncbi:MAG: type II toxin-antitoxin system VapC family toxin [Deltaproteobacteria bacterium]|nr:type II toxin-antitoxin system VapC family toxin [Deltaproteobacteria bacterium]